MFFAQIWKQVNNMIWPVRFNEVLPTTWKIIRCIADRVIFPAAKATTTLRTQFTKPKNPVTNAMRFIEPLPTSK